MHIRPKVAADGAPLLVFYHGGGFVVGGYETHGNLCEVISDRAGVHVLFVDYRLAPEHKAPAAVDDAYAAYRWALDHAKELGADASRVAVGGDSAGGNLAAVVSQRARDEGAAAPALQLLLYPMSPTRKPDPVLRTSSPTGTFFAAGTWSSAATATLGDSGVDPADPMVSPLLAEDLSGLPPAMSRDRRASTRSATRAGLYAEALRSAGARWTCASTVR